MVVKVYYAEISGNKEVKKHQQRVMMILDSKQISYEAVDITEAGKESEKEFMMKNAKPKGDAKTVLSPQVFNDEVYCGDYDDFDMANENDILEEFLHTEKVTGHNVLNGSTNGTEILKVSQEETTKHEEIVDDAEPVTQIEEAALQNQDGADSEQTASHLTDTQVEPSIDSSIPITDQTKASNVPQITEPSETEETDE